MCEQRARLLWLWVRALEGPTGCTKCLYVGHYPSSYTPLSANIKEEGFEVPTPVVMKSSAIQGRVVPWKLIYASEQHVISIFRVSLISASCFFFFHGLFLERKVKNELRNVRWQSTDYTAISPRRLVAKDEKLTGISIETPFVSSHQQSENVRLKIYKQ
jgi:hypothetical protein